MKGPASAANAVDAVQLIDIGERSQFYHALAARLIKRPEDRICLIRLFEIFWQNPQWLQRVRGMLLPDIEMPKEADDDEDPVLRRLQEALSDQAESPDADLEPAAEKIEIDATLTFSSQEVFRAMDFQMMSATELREAEKAVDAIDLPFLMRPSHRFRPTSTGAVISFRRTLQQWRYYMPGFACRSDKVGNRGSVRLWLSVTFPDRWTGIAVFSCVSSTR